MNKSIQDNASKKRQLLLVLPCLILPFLAFLFWVLGGNKPDTPITEKGLNAALPEAHVPNDSTMNKMEFYDQEEKTTGANDELLPQDSAALSLLMSNPDAAYAMSDNSDMGQFSLADDGTSGNPATSEKRIRQTIAKLEKGMQEIESGQSLSEHENTTETNYTNSKGTQATTINSLPELTAAEEQPDPEMEQLKEMMNRIYDIQHPDEVRTRLEKASAATRGAVFPVGSIPEQQHIHLLSNKSNTGDSMQAAQLYIEKKAGFYGLNQQLTPIETTDKGILVTVQENTMVVNGASVKLRLLQDIYVNGITIPKGNFITGKAQLSNDRVGIELQTILYQQSVLQVKLTAYDTDGMEGLYVPGAITRDVVKQSGDNALQTVGLGTLDPSLGAQAAAAGIETAKTLFSRKLKLTRVLLKAGHKFILKNN